MKRISLIIYLFIVNSGVISQTEVDISFSELKEAIKDRDLESLEIDSSTAHFSIKKGKRYTFYDIPISMLNDNNDFFLARKKVRAELTFSHEDGGFFIYLSDIRSQKHYKIKVNSNSSDDFFVKFQHGKRNYFRIKECENCTFTITEEDWGD